MNQIKKEETLDRYAKEKKKIHCPSRRQLVGARIQNSLFQTTNKQK
jgi:hypothetical protein